jgi:hypothetical protein
MHLAAYDLKRFVVQEEAVSGNLEAVRLRNRNGGTNREEYG